MNNNNIIMSMINRLKLELTELEKTPPSNCSAGMIDNDIYEWQATIMGSKRRSI